MSNQPEFELYDEVIKDTGDYIFRGVVIAVMEKVLFDNDGYFLRQTGNYRYAVQNRDGLIHIFNGKQLRKDE